MAEAYKKTGRGGAGNFYSKKSVEDVKGKGKAVDPESLPPATADLARALSASQQAPEYLHTGRGGAGNWLKPANLISSSLTQTTSPDPTSITPSSSASSTTDPGPSTSSSSSSLASNPPLRPGIGISKRVLGGSKATYKGGRGGAGNYTDFEAEEKARREEEERRRSKMERRVERDVEAGLARPARAYGGVVGGSIEMT